MTPPYYYENIYKINKEKHIVNYFKSIGKEINIGLMIYNQPRRNGIEITVDIYKRILKEVPNFLSVQDCQVDKNKTINIVRELSNHLSINGCGAGEEFAPAYLLFGVDGFITTIGNFSPSFTVKIFKLCKNKEYEKAIKLSKEYNPIYKILDEYPTIATIKLIMNFMSKYSSLDIFGGYVRPPLYDLSGKEYNDINKRLNVFLDNLND